MKIRQCNRKIEAKSHASVTAQRFLAFYAILGFRNKLKTSLWDILVASLADTVGAFLQGLKSETQFNKSFL